MRLRSEHWLNNAVTPCGNPVHTLCCNCPDEASAKFEGSSNQNQTQFTSKLKNFTNSGHEALITNEESLEVFHLKVEVLDGAGELQLDVVTCELDDSIIGLQGTTFFAVHFF